MKAAALNTLIDLMRKRKLTIAFAESVTAGLVSSEFSKGLEVSKVLKGSIVAYTTEIKQKVLGVKKESLEKHTPESPEVTAQMARGLKDLYDPDIALAVTGLANPGGSESLEKPVGTVFICIYYKNKTYQYRNLFSGKREEILQQIVNYILDLLEKTVLEIT